MPADRKAFDRVFAAANSRLSELSVERCRAIELAQTRAIRVVGPKPALLKALLRQMGEEPPSEAWRSRSHWSMRRVYKRLFDEGERAEVLQTALNAYLDGQTELAGKWMDLDTLVRPWGEH
ncbi:MAG: hypothetical protein EP330_18350 [Deltaproteobacteria bacterium]|nr:MAG: hypothetical protein EP330_18350 [Deltaproteobacteria bacterium]